MFLFTLFFTIFIGSVAITYWAMQSASRYGFQDIPNERSSHSIPMPRWGGIAIFSNFILGLALLYAKDFLDKNIFYALAIGSSIVFLVGLWDDRYSLPARLRLIVHFVAGLWTLLFLTGRMPEGLSLDIGIAHLTNLWVSTSFALLFMAWMTNLYNFMDGSDGMAGSQAITVSVLLALLCLWRGHEVLAWMYVILAVASLGFMTFNWPPAKIFMGDCGSNFLGFIFGALALAGELQWGMPLVLTLILLAPFIVDATYTLVLRTLMGFRPFEPHREFAFQRLIQRGWGARRTMTWFMAITLFFELPMAMGALTVSHLSFVFLMLAYAPLITLCVYLRAGLPRPLQLVGPSIHPTPTHPSQRHPSELQFDDTVPTPLPIFQKPPARREPEASPSELL